MNYPFGLAFNTSGDLFIADGGNNAVREVSAKPVPRNSSVDGRFALLYGQSLTVTAAVSATGGTPGGTVAFFIRGIISARVA